MDWPPVCTGRYNTLRSVVTALTLMALVTATVLLATVRRPDNGEGTSDGVLWESIHRQRRSTDLEPATSTPGDKIGQAVTGVVPDESGDYFPVYRQVGGRSIDWDSEQMSTDGFNVQSMTDFIDDEDDYDESAASLDEDLKDDYIDDEDSEQETSKSDMVDVHTDSTEELVTENVNSSSPHGKEFAEYYAEFDDGQRFDEEEYETTFIKPGMHYGDNVEVVEQLMVRGEDDESGSVARRARLTSRRRRRRRPRPLRRRRIRVTRRRRPRRLLRVPGETKSRLNMVRLSRDNIQLHPSRSPSSSVPRLVSYSQPATQYVSKATGAVQYVTLPDYAVDSASQANPVFIQLQKPLSPSLTVDSGLGLPEDIQVIGLSDRKATSSVGNGQESNYGKYTTTANGDVVVPVTLHQLPLDVTSVQPQEVLFPLQVSSGDQQQAGVQLMLPVKNSADQSSSSAVQLMSAADNGELTIIPLQTVPDQQPSDSRPTGTLRTLPDVRSPSPTYVILKLPSNEAAGNERRGSSGGVLAGHRVDLGDKVKYIDLSELLSKPHTSVTSAPPSTYSRRPPKQRRRPTRPRTGTKPARRRRPRPPPARGQAPPTPPTPSRHRLRPPPVPRPAPPPAPSQPTRNDQRPNYNQHRFEVSRHSPDQRQYPHHSPPHHYQQQHQYQQQQQQQHQHSQRNEHHHSNLSPRYQAQSGAILPVFRPSSV